MYRTRYEVFLRILLFKNTKFFERGISAQPPCFCWYHYHTLRQRQLGRKSSWYLEQARITWKYQPVEVTPAGLSNRNSQNPSEFQCFLVVLAIFSRFNRLLWYGCLMRKRARYFPMMRPTPMKPGQPCKKTALCARLAGKIPLQTRAKRRQKILGMGHGMSQVKKNRFFGAPPRANPLPSGCARVSECAPRKFWGYFGSVEAGKSGRR